MSHFERKIAIRICKMICPEELLESIIGDLEEQYECNKATKSEWVASLLLLYNTLRFLRPGILKRNKENYLNINIYLLINFFKVFGRSTKRNLRFSLINLFCLVVGLSVVSYTLLYLKNETSYDTFHKKSDNTYRIAGQRAYGPWFPSLEIPETRRILNNEYTWLEKATCFSRVPDRFVQVGETKFPESKVIVVESGDSFFDVFDFKMIHGNREEVTKNTNSMIISESHAFKYFGHENPIGKAIYFDSLTVNVSGVFEDLPINTHLVFDLILVSDRYYGSKHSAFMYVIVNENPDYIEKEILRVAREENEDLGIAKEEVMIDVSMQNITDIHLNSSLTFELKTGGDKNQLSIFGATALIILMISCTNFTNLSTAIFSHRRKEMAVRKVLGSKKSSLSLQFLFESVLMSMVALPIALLITIYSLPYYNHFIGIPFTLDHLLNLEFIFILSGISALTGFLGGIYPSLIMPRIRLLNLFKSNYRMGSHGGVRKALIGLQFFLLIGLGTVSFVINQQLSYINNYNIGMNKEGLVKLKRAWSLEGSEQIKSFKNKLLSQSFILGVSQGYISGDEDYPMTYLPEGFDAPFQDALWNPTDLEFLDLLDVSGTGPFFEEDEHPKSSLLVNEAFVKNLGWEHPIGKKIDLWPENPSSKLHEIRGVVSNFNFFSLHQGVTPQMIQLNQDRSYVDRNILIKIDLAHANEAFQWIEAVWDEYQPANPINYAFVDQDLQRAYEKDQQTALASELLSILAAILSITGLIGITAYLISQKTKEIGIRKILGASSKNLLIKFNSEYIPLIAIATILSSTISYFFLNLWLENFAYRVSIDLLIFPIGGLMLAGLVIATVSLEALKTIQANPVDALRYE